MIKKTLPILAASILPVGSIFAAWNLEQDFQDPAAVSSLIQVRNQDNGAAATIVDGVLSVHPGDALEQTANLYVLVPLSADLAEASNAIEDRVTLFFEVIQPEIEGVKSIIDTAWGPSHVEEVDLLTTRYDSFTAMQRVDSVSGNFETRTTGAYVTHEPLQAGVRYKIWMLIDYFFNDVEIYIQGGQWAQQTQLLNSQGGTTFGFRANPGAGQTVDKFGIALSRGNSAEPKGTGPTYFDNIYIDLAGPNLSDPVGGSGPTWAFWPIDPAGWVDTGAFLSWVYVQGDWVWVENIKNWVFLPENHVSADGAWGYITNSN